MSMTNEAFAALQEYNAAKGTIEAILAGYGQVIDVAPSTRAETLKKWSKGDDYDRAKKALESSIMYRKKVGESYGDKEPGHEYRLQLEQRLLDDLASAKAARIAAIHQLKVEKQKLDAMDTTKDVAGFPGMTNAPPKPAALKGVWAVKK